MYKPVKEILICQIYTLSNILLKQVIDLIAEGQAGNKLLNYCYLFPLFHVFCLTAKLYILATGSQTVFRLVEVVKNDTGSIANTGIIVFISNNKVLSQGAYAL